jgi:hypothetical protein
MGERWDTDMAKMNEGITRLFLNDFKEAETIFLKGMDDDSGRKSDEHDLRGAFGLNYGLAAVIRGISTLSNDQLDECQERMWEADRLASEGDKWIGQDICRGICTALGGLIQIMQHNFLKGSWNLIRSWMWVRRLMGKEAQEFEGKEREVVRSASIFTLGIFNLIISLLPPKVMKTASWISGFGGDRKEALMFLSKCWSEQGMLSPWAALVICAYQVDAKTFLGEVHSAADFRDCNKILEWQAERYPNSIFFIALRADAVALEKRDPAAARTICATATGHVGDLVAFEWVLNYKQALFCLAQLKFEEAAELFVQSLHVYVTVGRRSMVPFMAMYAIHASLVAGGKANEERTVEMLLLVRKYRALPKKNWGRQDKWAFKVSACRPRCTPVIHHALRIAFYVSV